MSAAPCFKDVLEHDLSLGLVVLDVEQVEELHHLALTVLEPALDEQVLRA